MPSLQERADSFSARACEIEAELAMMEIMRMKNPQRKHAIKAELRHCLKEAARLTREAML